MTVPNQPSPLPTPFLQDGTAFTALAYPAPGPAGARGPEGPPGPKGDTGPVSDKPVLWIGQGEPPEWIDGAKLGDTWLDTITGNTYTLT